MHLGEVLPRVLGRGVAGAVAARVAARVRVHGGGPAGAAARVLVQSHRVAGVLAHGRGVQLGGGRLWKMLRKYLKFKNI